MPRADDYGVRVVFGLIQQPLPPQRPHPLEITVTPRGAIDLDTARRYADLGVHRRVLQPPSMDGSAMDELITSAGDTLIGQA